MKRILLTMIIANQEGPESAEPLKNEILALLRHQSTCLELSRYEKIPNCVKAVFEVYSEVSSDSDFNYDLLTLSSSIARPWMIWFQNNFATELIFSKSEGTSYHRESFSDIIWAHIQHGA